MEVEIVTFGHLNGHTHEEPRLHLYGTESVAPFYVIAKEPGKYKVPISKPCTLCIQLFTLQRTDEKRFAYQRTGHAFVSKAIKRVELLADDGRTVIGSVTLDVKQPHYLVPLKSFVNIGTGECGRWASQYHPCHHELEQIHVDKMQNLIQPSLPGFVFSLLQPREDEDEVLFERAACICMRRRGLVSLDTNADTAVLIMAETLQCIVACNSYTQDIEFVGQQRVAVDRFSADIRVCGDGDCEDQAHEVMMLWKSLRRMKCRTELVRRLQQAARQYICFEILGAINLPYDPRLSVYSTGTMYAHAYNMLFPVTMLEQCLDQELALDEMCAPSKGDILTLDATRNNDPNYLHPSYPWQCTQQFSRARGVDAIDAKHYLYLCSAYVADGLVYKGTSFTTPEIFFVNSKKERGIAYDEVHAGKSFTVKPTVAFETFTSMVPQISEQLKLFHPIPKYQTQLPPPQIQLTEMIPASLAKGELFINSNDVQDKGYLADMRRKLADKNLRWTEQLEFVAQPYFWGLRIIYT